MEHAQSTVPARPDSRADQRRRVLLAGKIVEGGGAFSTDCGIRDLSEAGARLRLPSPVPVGDDFYLLEVRNGRAYRAQVRWRQGAEIGVRFVHPDPVDEPGSPQRRMLDRLWAQVAAR